MRSIVLLWVEIQGYRCVDQSSHLSCVYASRNNTARFFFSFSLVVFCRIRAKLFQLSIRFVMQQELSNEVALSSRN